jgi:CubicO group peptidase (beta-lactamase class C family)
MAIAKSKFILGGKVLLSAAVLLATAGITLVAYLAPLASGYAAKALCSNVFLAGRSAQSVYEEELDLTVLLNVQNVEYRLDSENKLAWSTLFGMGERVAVYREGLGCTLSVENGPAELAQARLSLPVTDSTPDPAETPWPMGDLKSEGNPSTGIDQAGLEALLDEAFREPGGEVKRRTRAIVVVHRGQIIAERYAPGFDADTPQLGWSMGKSITNALLGILVQQGRLSLDQQMLFPEWGGADDERKQISLENLLRMNSGLHFKEEYTNPFDGVVHMLYKKGDMARFAREQSLEHPPGEVFDYSSGTTNLLSNLIRRTIGNDQAYFRFPHQELFEPLGMRSAVMETDESGTYAGSSYVYATPRDWARFGLLYLRDGIWQGRRILPEGWVDLTTTDNATNGERRYGAHFWLKVPFPHRADNDTNVTAEDAYHAAGHDGQFVSIIPSQDLVVVRMGLSRGEGAWDHVGFINALLPLLLPSG